ncbi:hypothetical protein CR513_28797, partial [Mucuna pruriens]
MILRENGDIESENSQKEISTSRSEGGYSSQEIPYKVDLLMVSIVSKFGKYKDEILRDVVPIVTHDGVTNKFSFVHKGNKVTLKPLIPREVMEDQIKMKQKREKEEKEKEKGKKLKGEKTKEKM